MWPFSKKESPSQTTCNQLRASLGMAPAREDDCCEAVAFVVVQGVLAADVADECSSLPAQERGLFMMAFASYLSWLAWKTIESRWPPNSWAHVAPLLIREFSKQTWYEPKTMSQIFSSIARYSSWGESRGRYFDASPDLWFDAVTATTLAGYKLNYSSNIAFTLAVAVRSSKLIETTTRMAADMHGLAASRCRNGWWGRRVARSMRPSSCGSSFKSTRSTVRYPRCPSAEGERRRV